LGAALRNLQRYSENGGSSQFPETQFDWKGVEFDPWIRLFIRQVKRNGIIPYKAMSMNGHVAVTFNVGRDGTITGVEIPAPSIVEEFNNAARRAIIASKPTQPLPPSIPPKRRSLPSRFTTTNARPSQMGLFRQMHRHQRSAICACQTHPHRRY
jgi:TonB family protein